MLKNFILLISLSFFLFGCTAKNDTKTTCINNPKILNARYNPANDRLTYRLDIPLSNYCYDLKIDKKSFLLNSFLIEANATYTNALCAQSTKYIKIKGYINAFKKYHKDINYIKLIINNLHSGKKWCIIQQLGNF